MGTIKRGVSLFGAVFFRNSFTLNGSVRFVCRNMSVKALVVEEFGDSSKLKYSETTKPDPAEGEVSI